MYRLKHVRHAPGDALNDATSEDLYRLAPVKGLTGHA